MTAPTVVVAEIEVSYAGSAADLVSSMLSPGAAECRAVAREYGAGERNAVPEVDPTSDVTDGAAATREPARRAVRRPAGESPPDDDEERRAPDRRAPTDRARPRPPSGTGTSRWAAEAGADGEQGAPTCGGQRTGREEREQTTEREAAGQTSEHEGAGQTTEREEAGQTTGSERRGRVPGSERREQVTGSEERGQSARGEERWQTPAREQWGQRTERERRGERAGREERAGDGDPGREYLSTSGPHRCDVCGAVVATLPALRRDCPDHGSRPEPDADGVRAGGDGTDLDVLVADVRETARLTAGRTGRTPFDLQLAVARALLRASLAEADGAGTRDAIASAIEWTTPSVLAGGPDA